jgi:hypothetical protein
VDTAPVAPEAVPETEPVASEMVPETEPVASEMVSETEPVAPEAVSETEPVAPEAVSETESTGSETVVEPGSVIDDAASEMRIGHFSPVKIAAFETVPMGEEIGSSSATTGVARAAATASSTNDKPSVFRRVAGCILSPPARLRSGSRSHTQRPASMHSFDRRREIQAERRKPRGRAARHGGGC